MAATPAARIWFRIVDYAVRQGGVDYARWAARHVPEIPGNDLEVGNTVSDLLDWVQAKSGRQFITRRFSAEMGLKAALAASADWHEAVANNSDCDEGLALPPPWYPAAKVGAFEIIPLTTVLDLYHEGRAMHHCVGTYAESVREGHCYVYSVRRNGKPVATLSLGHYSGRTGIEQLRGPCNADPGKAIWAACPEVAQRAACACNPISTTASCRKKSSVRSDPMQRETEVRALFKRHSYTIERVERGRHWKVWANRNGLTRRFIVPASPSDHRSIKNTNADLRRGYANGGHPP